MEHRGITQIPLTAGVNSSGVFMVHIFGQVLHGLKNQLLGTNGILSRFPLPAKKPPTKVDCTYKKKIIYLGPL